MCIYWVEACPEDHVFNFIHTDACAHANFSRNPEYCSYNDPRLSTIKFYRNETDNCRRCQDQLRSRLRALKGRSPETEDNDSEIHEEQEVGKLEENQSAGGGDESIGPPENIEESPEVSTPAKTKVQGHAASTPINSITGKGKPGRPRKPQKNAPSPKKQKRG